MSSNNNLEEQAEAFKVAGNKAMENKQYSEAIDQYTKAIECSAKREFHANRSLAYLKLGKFDSALADGQAARHIDSSWWRAHFRIGAAFEAMGKRFEAMEAYKRAYELNPRDVRVLEVIKNLKGNSTDQRDPATSPSSAEALNVIFNEEDDLDGEPQPPSKKSRIQDALAILRKAQKPVESKQHSSSTPDSSVSSAIESINRSISELHQARRRLARAKTLTHTRRPQVSHPLESIQLPSRLLQHPDRLKDQSLASETLLRLEWDDSKVQDAWKQSAVHSHPNFNEDAFSSIDYPLDPRIIQQLQGWALMRLGKVDLPASIQEQQPESIISLTCDEPCALLENKLVECIAAFADACLVDLSGTALETIASKTSISKETCIPALFKILVPGRPTVWRVPYSDFESLFVKNEPNLTLLLDFVDHNPSLVVITDAPPAATEEQSEEQALLPLDIFSDAFSRNRNASRFGSSNSKLKKSQKSKSQKHPRFRVKNLGGPLGVSGIMAIDMEDSEEEATESSLSQRLDQHRSQLQLEPKSDSASRSLWYKKLREDARCARIQQHIGLIESAMKPLQVRCNELSDLEASKSLREYLADKRISDSNMEKVVLNALRVDIARKRISKRDAEGYISISCDAIQVVLQQQLSLHKPPTDRAHRTPEELAALASNQHEQALLSLVVDAADVQVPWSDVGGLGSVKEILKETTVYPLKYPELYQEGSASEATKGVLLFGPPGTGKTMLAKAVATETGATFMNIDSASISSKWYGEAEKMARAVFTLARKLAPTVIFIDEIDSLLSARDDSEKSTIASVKTTLMREWDGLGTTRDRVLVIGATNRPYILDEAILRRMPRRIMVDLPDETERLAILQVGLRNNRLDSTVDLKHLAQDLSDYSGSDLRELCREAAVSISNSRARELEELVSKGDEIPEGMLVLRALSKKDFEEARKKIRPSVSRDSSMLSKIKEWNEQFGEGAAGKQHGFYNMFL